MTRKQAITGLVVVAAIASAIAISISLAGGERCEPFTKWPRQIDSLSPYPEQTRGDYEIASQCTLPNGTTISKREIVRVQIQRQEVKK